jgi:hypothetical protein
MIAKPFFPVGKPDRIIAPAPEIARQNKKTAPMGGLSVALIEV